MPRLISCQRCKRRVSSDAVRKVAGLIVCPRCAPIVECDAKREKAQTKEVKRAAKEKQRQEEAIQRAIELDTRRKAREVTGPGIVYPDSSASGQASKSAAGTKKPSGQSLEKQLLTGLAAGLLLVTCCGGACVGLLGLGNGRSMPPPGPKPIPTPRAERVPTYEILERKVSDMPIKSMVNYRVLMPKETGKTNVERVMHHLHREANRARYKYNPSPQVWIYVYNDRRCAGPEWIAMLEGQPGQSPRISFAIPPKASPEKKFGLVEDQRRTVYVKIGVAGDRAAREAEASFPVGPGASRGELVRQATDEEQRRAKYYAEICREYGIEKDNLYSILAEGVKMKWPSGVWRK